MTMPWRFQSQVEPRPFLSPRSYLFGLRGDKATVVMERGSVNIRPEAYISSGRIKVPIGWERNEIEVPYEMLIDELAARAGIKVQMA